MPLLEATPTGEAQACDRADPAGILVYASSTRAIKMAFATSRGSFSLPGGMR
jgi:hypothetical protein